MRSRRSSRAEAVRSYLRGRLDETTLADLVQTKDHDFQGVGHADFGQRVAGLDVYGTYVRASFSSDGSLVSVIENLVPTTRALRPAQIGPDAALRSVLARYYPGAGAALRETSTVGNVSTFERRGPFDTAPTVTRVAVPLAGAVLDVGFLVVTWDRDNILRHTVVSGRGQIVHEELRTNSERYFIFPNHPGVTPQQWGEVSPDANPLSPNGWVSSNTTIGNNVDAYFDRDNNNAADATAAPMLGDAGDFSCTVQPRTRRPPVNQKAAVTNLFYLNNVLHDRLYRHGFNESAGNFQTNNFGPGGAGNDPVTPKRRTAAAPTTRTSPRRPMAAGRGCRCTLDFTDPDRDGDLDSDIVYHEYGHGLTWRMIGGMTGAFAGAIGEGMGDTLATYFNANDRVGEYSTGNPIGIRRDPTPTTRTPTATSAAPACTATARSTRRRCGGCGSCGSRSTACEAAGHAVHYVVNGMNFTPSRPAFEDMRDGILASITNEAGRTRGQDRGELCRLGCLRAFRCRHRCQRRRTAAASAATA